jgi:hypothetical protein
VVNNNLLFFANQQRLFRNKDKTLTARYSERATMENMSLDASPFSLSQRHSYIHLKQFIDPYDPTLELSIDACFAGYPQLCIGWVITEYRTLKTDSVY